MHAVRTRGSFRFALLALTLITAGLLAAGCGDDDSSEGDAGELAASTGTGVESLPEEVRAAYKDLGQPVDESPWVDFEAPNGPPWKIGYSSEYAGNTWRAAALDRFEEVAQKYEEAGLVSDTVVTQSNLNDATQIQQIKQLVDQGVDAIITCCPSVEALNSAIKYAADRDVPFFVYSGYTTSPYSINVSSNYQRAGLIEGEWLAEEMGGEGNVLNVVGIPGASASDSFDRGLKAALKEYPDIKIVGDVVGQWTDQVAKTEVLKFLSTHPEEIDGIAVQSASETGALQGLLESGRPVVPLTIGGEIGPACYWRKNPDWISQGFHLWPPGNEMEGTFDVMIRTLQGQGPKIQSVTRDILPFDIQEVEESGVPADCDVNDTGWFQPPIEEWWGPELQEQFFQDPEDPLEG